MTATPDYYKSQEVFDYPLLSLIASNEQYSDEAIIRFIEGNTEKFDLNYDASKLFSRNDKVPQISMVSGKDILALNTYSQIEDDLMVPLNFDCSQEGYYTLEISDRTNLNPGTEVYLKDKVTDEMVHFSDELRYHFYHDPYNSSDRFIIFFNPNPDLINNLIPENYFSVYTNKNKVILVKNSVKELNGSVMVFNMHGQIVYSNTLYFSASNTFTLNVVPGYYVVQIRTDETVNNSKIVITN
jgi:hypothetical protein